MGFNHGNGKSKTLIYHKYRCRACGRYLNREELHPKIEKHFQDNLVTPEGMNDLRNALNIVWEQREAQAKHDTARISGRIAAYKADITTQAVAAVQPDNSKIKEELFQQYRRDEA